MGAIEKDFELHLLSFQFRFQKLLLNFGASEPATHGNRPFFAAGSGLAGGGSCQSGRIPRSVVPLLVQLCLAQTEQLFRKLQVPMCPHCRRIVRLKLIGGNVVTHRACGDIQFSPFRVLMVLRLPCQLAIRAIAATPAGGLLHLPVEYGNPVAQLTEAGLGIVQANSLAGDEFLGRLRAKGFVELGADLLSSLDLGLQRSVLLRQLAVKLVLRRVGLLPDVFDVLVQDGIHNEPGIVGVGVCERDVNDLRPWSRSDGKTVPEPLDGRNRVSTQPLDERFRRVLVPLRLLDGLLIQYPLEDRQAPDEGDLGIHE